MNFCKGKTLAGKNCTRKVKLNDNFCYQHRFCENKPVDCVVCCESLSNEEKPLDCGHWIHIDCIINTAKAECPICRKKLQFKKNILDKIEILSKKRKAEVLEEEEEELRLSLENQITELLEPALGNRINVIINDVINQNGDINIIDILSEIIDDTIF